MKLKCIKNNINGKILPIPLTIGKTYDFDSISEEALFEDSYVGSSSSYYLKNDIGYYRYYPREWFIDIIELRVEKLKQLGI